MTFALVPLLMVVTGGFVGGAPQKPFEKFPITEEFIEAAFESGGDQETSELGLHFSHRFRGAVSPGTATTPSPDPFNQTPGPSYQPGSVVRVVLYSPFAWIQQQTRWAAEENRPFNTTTASEFEHRWLRMLLIGNLEAAGGERKVDVGIVLHGTGKNESHIVTPMKLHEDSTCALRRLGDARLPCRVAYFDMNQVTELSAIDKKKEFFVLVIHESGDEKKFKVKSKQFHLLP